MISITASFNSIVGLDYFYLSLSHTKTHTKIVVRSINLVGPIHFLTSTNLINAQLNGLICTPTPSDSSYSMNSCDRKLEAYLSLVLTPLLLHDDHQAPKTFLSPLMEEKPAVFSSRSPVLFYYYLVILISFYKAVSPSGAQLSLGFYSAACPSAEFMVRNTVRSASSRDPTIPGKLLRLVFHDCFVEGCDASVLLQGNGTERSDPANGSLDGFSVVDSAKRVLEFFCPETVSCADIVALAARDAVEFAGGPAVPIPTGRRDGKVSSASNVRPNIIDTSFTMDEMTKLFSSKGLSLNDLVILSGAHTIGRAHCSAFSDRFKQDSKGKLTLIDASLDRAYADELIKQCPAQPNPSTTVDNDPETASLFDNQYYKNLLSHKGLFQSDSVLFSDGRTRELVESFANDQFSFFDSWSRSFLKLTSLGVKTGDEGEIRVSCSSVNA